MRSNLMALVSEELQKLWYKNIEGPIECVAIQHFGRIFAYLLECTKSTFTRAIVTGVKHLDQSRQEFGPIDEFSFGGNGRNKNANSGPDKRRGVAHTLQTLILYELSHLWRELMQMCSDIVLENQTAKWTGRLVWKKSIIWCIAWVIYLDIPSLFSLVKTKIK